MLEKIIPAGGPDGWGPGYQQIHRDDLEKIATECYTPHELVEVMGELVPRPEGRYILLNAMGAYEYWGFNKNNDAFPEWSLKGELPPQSVKDLIEHKVKVKIPNFTVPPQSRYGHRTFVDFAKVYVGHKNTDPTKSIGDVIASAYNEKMHRVELIVFVYTDRNPELVAKLDAGEPVPFSMGSKLQFDVCLLPGQQISTPEGYVAIEALDVGDEVFTQQGNVRKVTKTFETPGEHEVVKIKVSGVGDSLDVTTNHPVYVLKEKDARSCNGSANDKVRRHNFELGTCKTCGITEEDLLDKASFIAAADVEEGDYVLVPSVQAHHDENIPEDLAYVAGLYLGDGSFIYSSSKRYGRKAVGVSICCQDDEQYIDFVKSSLEAVSAAPVHVYPAGSDRKAFVVQTHDEGLASFLHGQCQSKKDKRIPPIIWSSTLESKRALLAGLIDSDGSVDPKKKSTRFCNTSAELVQGTQLLGVACGLAPTYYWSTSTSSYGTSTYGTVTLGSKATHDLAGVSYKCGEIAAAPRWSNKGMQMTTGVWYPVQTVTEGQYTGPVYNVSVEGDETYLVSNVAVHNCSVCGNIARTRGEYCEHLRFFAGKALPDGRQVFSYNFFPRFFDISYVRVPADRSAWGLKKVANVTNADIEIPRLKFYSKLAGLVKEEPADGETLGQAPVNPKLINFIKSRAKDQLDHCREDPNLVGMAKGLKLKKVLASLSALGILLKPTEVTKLSSSDGNSVFPKFDIKDVDPEYVRKFAPFVEQRSFYDPHFTKKAAKAVESGSAQGTETYDRQYVEYLKSIDIKKLAEWYRTPAAAVAIDESRVLQKVAGLKVLEPRTPGWLPYFATLLNIDNIIN